MSMLSDWNLRFIFDFCFVPLFSLVAFPSPSLTTPPPPPSLASVSSHDPSCDPCFPSPNSWPEESAASGELLPEYLLPGPRQHLTTPTSNHKATPTSVISGEVMFVKIEAAAHLTVRQEEWAFVWFPWRQGWCYFRLWSCCHGSLFCLLCPSLWNEKSKSLVTS